MATQTRAIDYQHDGKAFEGLFAAPGGKRPTVLVSHAWAGRGQFEIDTAKRMADWGYNGFALDLYGKGVLGTSTEENQGLMMPLMKDRPKLQDRLKTALKAAREQPETEAAKVAIIGFCFGGLCALDLARVGADVKGAVSMHGIFVPPGNTEGTKITAKVIAYHGWDDPMAKPESVVSFAEEMTKAGADWQLVAHGNTMHSFMTPGMNDPSFGTVYNPVAERRTWAYLKEFLAEAFA